MIWMLLLATAVILTILSYVNYRRRRQLIINKRQLLEKRLAKVHKEMDLLVALSEYLLPLKEDMDRLGANVEGRHAVLKIDDWPKQYAFGIEKCAGFDLDWK